MLGASRYDPMNQRKSIVGEKLVDTVMDEMCIDDLLKLALRKITEFQCDRIEPLRVLEEKLKEARFWNDQLEHQLDSGIGRSQVKSEKIK